MLQIPLKYRITAAIFSLSAIILTIVLSQSLSQYLKGSRVEQAKHEQATLILLGDFARIALLTTDYETFQPQLEQVTSLSGVSAILLADDQGIIVATSKPGWIGQSLTDNDVNTSTGWQLLLLKNMSGELGTLAAKFSDDALVDLHDQIRSKALTWSLFGLLIIALVSLMTGHLLTRRLSLITRTAEAVSNGDLSARTKIQGHDEVAELGRVFDTMVHKLNTDRAQLAEREQYLSLTLDSIGDAVITTDAKGCISRMNPVAEELTGWQSSEAHGHPLPDIFKIINAESRQIVSNPVERVLKSRQIVGLANHTVLINKNNTEYQIADSAAPIIDSNGNILGVILVFRDVTQQYEVEEALRRSQKMDAIGQLSGGIAHDFNNQLNVVIGYLDFLNNHFSETEKPYKWVQSATKATLRCIDLTRQLLSFSRRQPTDKTAINLNSTFDELRDMISRSVTPEIDVQYSLAENLCKTETNKGEFQDVVVNLVLNARDAMPNGGKIVIETSNTYFDKDFSDLNLEIKKGEYAQLAISDTGAGMNKELQEHIFEPFFTTKPVGKGTGLGMSMIYGFIKRYDGYIKVNSEPGIGSIIRIYLPCSKITDISSENINQNINIPTGSESILIVDDEIDLLELAEQFFSELGYKTKIADNAETALEVLKSDHNIDLLFSDVVMPGGINGYDLALQATQLHSELKVLLTSGFTSKSILKSEHKKFETQLLSKPYRKIDLAKMVRLILDNEKQQDV